MTPLCCDRCTFAISATLCERCGTCGSPRRNPGSARRQSRGVTRFRLIGGRADVLVEDFAADPATLFEREPDRL